MNIFITDIDPIKSAKYLDDRRVVKMCLETAQMLSTALVILKHTERCKSCTVKSKKERYEYYIKGTTTNIPSPTHPYHPCNVWVRQSKQNFLWLAKHGIALCKEYTKRYNKTHKYELVIRELSKHADLFPSIGLTQFVNCAANKQHNIDYKNEPIIYTAYMKYLNDRWELTDKNPTYYGRRI